MAIRLPGKSKEDLFDLYLNQSNPGVAKGTASFGAKKLNLPKSEPLANVSFGAPVRQKTPIRQGSGARVSLGASPYNRTKTSAPSLLDRLGSGSSRILKSEPGRFVRGGGETVSEIGKALIDIPRVVAKSPDKLGTVRDLGVSLVREIPRTGARIGTSLSEAFGDTKSRDIFDPNVSPITRFLMGSEPVQSYQQEAADISPDDKIKAAGALTALGLLDVADVGDVARAGKAAKRAGRAKVTMKATDGPAVDVNKALRGAEEAQRAKLPKDSKIDKALRKGFDPLRDFSKIDAEYARSIGVRNTNLPAAERLEALADVSVKMGGPDGAKVALQKMRNHGLDEIIQRYGEGTPAGVEFRNYQNSKFALEVAEKRGLLVLADDAGNKLQPEDLSRFVKEYEATNPRAVTDNKAFKRWADERVDEAARAKLLEPDSAKYVKDFYDNYVPIERVFPEELARPEIGINPVGTVGRQKIIQNLEGSSLPANTSFDVFLKKGHTTEKQIAQNNLFNKTVERIGQGVVGDSKVIQTADDVRQVRAMKEAVTELSTLRKQFRAQATKQKGKRPLGTQALKRAKTDAVNKVKAVLRKTTKDPDAYSAINNLSYDDVIQILDRMSGSDGTKRVAKNLGKATKARHALDLHVDALRSAANQISDDITGLRQGLREASTGSTTGRQIIAGMEDGLPVKVEVSPQLATIMQGLDDQKLSALTKVLAGAAKPFRSAFTGLLNPIFSVVSYGFYDLPMGLINSKQGFRTVFSPKAWSEGLQAIVRDTPFQKQLLSRGAQVQQGSMMTATSVVDAKYIAAQKDLFTKIKRTLDPRNIGETIEKLDQLGGRLANSTRTRIAKAEFDGAIARGMSEPDALSEAVYAFNNVMPNYGRTTKLLKELDSVAIYSNASIAGTRSFAQAVKRRPIATLAKATGVMGVSTAIVANALASEEGQAFYDDMVASGNTGTLDYSSVFVLPGANKDPKTGEWEGVIKIPVAPELRGLWSAAWRAVRDLTKGQNETTPAVYANALLDTVTGGLFKDPDNPALSTMVGLTTNTNMRYGGDIVPDDMQKLPAEEQVFKSTSDIAKTIGEALNISPIKVDYVIRQFGAGGRMVTGQTTPLGELDRRFTRAVGMSQSREYYSWLNGELENMTERDRTNWESLHSYDEDADSPFYTQQRASTYLNSPATYALDRERALRAEEQLGKPINPLYSYPQDQVEKILKSHLRQVYINNEPWYDQWKTDQKAYYDAKYAWDKQEGYDTSWYEEYAAENKKQTASTSRSSGGRRKATIRPSQFAVSARPPSLGGSRIKKIAKPKLKAKFAAIEKPKVTFKKGTV